MALSTDAPTTDLPDAGVGGLRGVVERTVCADPTLSEEAKLLVVGALESDTALDELSGVTGPQPGSALPPQLPMPRQPDPVGAFLRRVTVRGFRGIGEEAVLSLAPTPGLTIVAGRNGSGKSSFAEGLEVALTGTTVRWEEKGVQWQGAWRNLHVGLAPRIQVTLSEQGIGDTLVEATWPESSGPEGRAVTAADVRTAVQRSGRKRESGLAGLGWTTPLELYRPLLSYEELGSLLAAAPSKLYDALSRMLGLGLLADAIGRLDVRHKDVGKAAKLTQQLKAKLKPLLDSTGDDRVETARKLLRPSVPDPEAIRALATGSDSAAAGSGAVLRALAAIEVPSEDAVLALADRLTTAVRALAEAGGASLDLLDRRHAVLEAAVALHEHAGDQGCPVCAVGTLDAARAAALRTESNDVSEALRALRAAQTEHRDTVKAATALLQVPPAVAVPAAPSVDAARELAAAAWQRWAEAPADALDLAGHLVSVHSELAEASVSLRRAADSALAAAADNWSTLAAGLLRFADQAQEMLAVREREQEYKAALTWLKQHDKDLKNERLRPIAEHAMRIWQGLRQESNVEISGLTLDGNANRRRVRITSSVDGADSQDMMVLSQGELHALALALFLPRAASPESPFRFIVLDDPVQAMDPSKVDGLLEVLSELARDRQVVVFSHDDRLAAAARRGGVEASILEVTREEGSVVAVRESLDPATRYLHDAEAIALDRQLPDDTKRRLLPGMLRMALEAAAHQRFFTNALAAGGELAAVTARWESVPKTGGKVALALFDDATRDLTPWLARKSYRRTALGVCTSALHNGIHTSPESALRAVQDLLPDVREGRTQ